MKILFLNWNGYGNLDIIESINRMQAEGKNIDLCVVDYDAHTPRDDEEFCRGFVNKIKEVGPDFVFSFNYFPIVSKACHEAGVKYASWVYDNPAVSLYSYTMINSCNYIFLFDSQMYETFASEGIKTVHYLPLAAATYRYDKIIPTEEDVKKWGGEISFVGGMYRSKGNFYDRIRDKISDYTKGYIEGLMKSQMELDGINIIEKNLPDAVLDDLAQNLGLKPNYDGVESYRYLYSNYVINRKITSIERGEILEAIGKKYTVNLFTDEKDYAPKGVINKGLADYYEEMPLIFKTSDINLNITLRSIQRGIPLRVMDILGCEGFLLTNYQPDMMSVFEPGKDFVYYESRQDLMEKIDYYLKNDDERKRVAKNGHEKVKADHTYEIRLEEIFSIVTGK